jgi:hypothetical protein
VQEAVWPLASWEAFYVIVGSSAAALTGLQFVVIVLGADLNALGGMPTISAFGTPTIMHFCAVLLISALMSAPWHGPAMAALALGACGVLGVAYMIVVIRQARRQTFYVPVLEDWTWHGVLPLVAYAALVAAAIVLPRRPVPSLFVIGAVAILLLFIGIHNAWDAVTYISARGRMQQPEGSGRPPSAAARDPDSSRRTLGS